MDKEEIKEIETKKLKPEELLALLKDGKDGKFSDIIGVEETEQIDFKEHLYRLNIEQNQYEFAKDIAAIANSGGGIICIGFEDGQHNTKLISYAKTLCPLPSNSLNLEQFSQVLTNKLVPIPPTDLVDYKFFGGNGKFYLAIRIKETPKEIIPFLIPWKNSQTEYFLCPYRHGSSTRSLLNINKLHEYVSAGYRRNLSGTNELSQINEKIDIIMELLNERENPPIPSEDFKKKYLDYAKEKIVSKSGFFYIYAEPARPLDFEFSWNKDKGSVYDLLLDPPRLRDNGWDLQTAARYGEPPYPVGDRWESMNGSIKLTLVDKRGVVFTAGALDDFLDWGVNDYKTSEKIPVGKLINNYALVEYVDGFAKFLLKLIDDHFFSADYRIEFGFILPDQEKVNLLRPFHLGVYFQSIVGPNLTTSSNIIYQSDSKLESKYLAGKIMEEIYASMFSQTDSLAYTGKDNKGVFVQEERYK